MINSNSMEPRFRAKPPIIKQLPDLEKLQVQKFDGNFAFPKLKKISINCLGQLDLHIFAKFVRMRIQLEAKVRHATAGAAWSK